MEKKKITAIVTMPPYAPYMDEVLKHPIVSGIRLNTVMPLKGGLEDNLRAIKERTDKVGKDLFLDLKCRQLRVKSFGVPPFTELELSHNIEVYTPTKAYFSDRNESATILEVNGNKLIMQEGPSRVVGPGESVTITHPTLKIDGYLTSQDREYVKAANSIGHNDYMLSFVEHQKDVYDLKGIANNPGVVAKLESQRALDNLEEIAKSGARLMAARGDLYMELHWPHEIVNAMQRIIDTDKDAIAASRILSSLARSPEPTCEDLFDVDSLLRMGYKTLMLGDEVCLKREPVMAALNVISYLARSY